MVLKTTLKNLFRDSVPNTVTLRHRLFSQQWHNGMRKVVYFVILYELQTSFRAYDSHINNMGNIGLFRDVVTPKPLPTLKNLIFL